MGRPGCSNRPARFRSSGPPGYILLALIASLGFLTLGGLWLMPSRTKVIDLDLALREEVRIQRLGKALIQSIEALQVIPGATGWDTNIALFTGWNLTEVRSTDTSHSSDSALQRVYLMDPGMGTSVLPYTQTSTGLTGAATNLAGNSGRVMIVSSSKRGLSLPVSSGYPSASAFNAVWDWGYNSSTKAPPTGWPSTWTGNGQHLHVARVQLKALFATLNLTNVNYGVGSGLSHRFPDRQPQRGGRNLRHPSSRHTAADREDERHALSKSDSGQQPPR